MRIPQLLWYDENEAGGEEDDEPHDMPCYDFNNALPEHMDDVFCIHCRKYLTLQCSHLELFMDELED